MPVAGTLSIKGLRKVFEEGGKDAVRDYYSGSSYFLLVLSDGFSTHVTWTPPGADTEEFIWSPKTPPEGNEDFSKESVESVDLLNLGDDVDSRNTKRVKRAYSSPTEDEEKVEELFDSASLILPLKDSLEVVSIGRGGLNDVKLTSTSISSMHAFFIKDPGKTSWGLLDRGSKNGTMIDGIALEKNKLWSSVAPGREVAFADIRCIFLDIWGLLDVCSV